MKIRIGPINLIGAIGAIILLLGLTGPWISQYYDKESSWDTEKLREIEIYKKSINFSPLIMTMIEDNENRKETIFYSLSTTISSLGIMIAGILATINFNRWQLGMSGFIIWMISTLIFFLSFGNLQYGFSCYEGCSLFGWGWTISIVGGITILISSITTLITER